MLSILIPIYNFDVTTFVAKLYNQAIKTDKKFEIIIADDCSSTYYRQINGELEKKYNLTYYQLNVNIGRSKIRNFLAQQANFDSLLFVDCDAKIVQNNYVQQFINEINGNKVVCGGRIYEKNKPQKIAFFLHWKYGTARETANATERNRHPNQSFMTNNFMISKKLLTEIQFNEDLLQYGHEDTLFGYELKTKGVIIKHIENPLVHIGLETADEFLEKTKQGVLNLLIIDANLNYPMLKSDIKLLRIYYKVYFLKFIFKITRKIALYLLSKNLKGKNPKLFLFDLYKLYLIFLAK